MLGSSVTAISLAIAVSTQAAAQNLYMARGTTPTPIIGPLPHVKHIPPIGLGAGTDTTTSNWAGYVNVISDPRDGPELEAFFVVPQFDNYDANVNMISIWGGFDGFNNNHMLQVGVDCYIDGSNRSDTGCYTWVQAYPDVTIALFPVSIGDVIGIYAFHNSPDSGPASSGVFVHDDTTGDIYDQSNDFTCNVPTCPSPDPYTGNSVEWIVEAPVLNGQLAHLPRLTNGGVRMLNDIMLSFTQQIDRYPNDHLNQNCYKLSMVQNGITVAVPQEIRPLAFKVVTYP